MRSVTYQVDPSTIAWTGQHEQLAPANLLLNANKGLVTDINGFLKWLEFNTADSLVKLEGTGLISSLLLPNTYDDINEYADLATLNALPAGDKIVGRIYIALDTLHIYRWTGAVFLDISMANHYLKTEIIAKLSRILGIIDGILVPDPDGFTGEHAKLQTQNIKFTVNDAVVYNNQDEILYKVGQNGRIDWGWGWGQSTGASQGIERLNFLEVEQLDFKTGGYMTGNWESRGSLLMKAKLDMNGSNNIDGCNKLEVDVIDDKIGGASLDLRATGNVIKIFKDINGNAKNIKSLAELHSDLIRNKNAATKIDLNDGTHGIRFYDNVGIVSKYLYVSDLRPVYLNNDLGTNMMSFLGNTINSQAPLQMNNQNLTGVSDFSCNRIKWSGGASPDMMYLNNDNVEMRTKLNLNNNEIYGVNKINNKDFEVVSTVGSYKTASFIPKTYCFSGYTNVDASVVIPIYPSSICSHSGMDSFNTYDNMLTMSNSAPPQRSYSLIQTGPTLQQTTITYNALTGNTTFFKIFVNSAEHINFV